MTEKVIVIGDVHGCAEELKILLHQLPLDQDTTLVFLGDYVDRGPDSKGVIDTVLNVSELYKVIALKGNHEWLFEEYLKKPNDAVAAGNFILNGGSATLASYSVDGSTFTVPNEHRAFLDGLQTFYATERHFFVHAGIPPGFDFAKEVDPKTAHQMLWIRSTFLDSKVQWPKIVVHGHTPVKVPEVLPNRINLDTGCVFGRSLTALDISNHKFYSVKRNQKADRRFLTVASFNGIPRAQRFEGEFSVELHWEDKYLLFKSVNFNEFGMLIRCVPGSPVLPLFVGRSISGTINTGNGIVFDFKGSVMRVDSANDTPMYGIKFDELLNTKET